MGNELGPAKGDIIKKFAKEQGIAVIDIPLNPDISLKLTSKESLKVLNEKEKKLKENIMKVIIKSKTSNKDVIRVLAFLINSFKRL